MEEVQGIEEVVGEKSLFSWDLVENLVDKGIKFIFLKNVGDFVGKTFGILDNLFTDFIDVNGSQLASVLLVDEEL